MSSTSHQLAAIMFTDIVGYTEMMGKDESRALDSLSKNKFIQQELLKKHNGTWHKDMGDGSLSSFHSANQAVKCAIEIQNQVQNAGFSLRIGIHLGDVTITEGDILGDGVNIASRLQAVAKPGSIYISESVQRAIRGQSINTLDVGEVKLKNVDVAVRVYTVQDGGLPTSTISTSLRKNKKLAIVMSVLLASVLGYVVLDFLPGSLEDSQNVLFEPAKSIAVLPFVNMSSDPEQEYFSDGISEELINALANIPGLKVPGRTSSFSFKGKDQDLKEIGEKLGVRSILEGSVRKSGNTLRITAQLVNCSDGYHMWSETYEREMTDVFKIQDEITGAIMNELKLFLGDNRQNISPTETSVNAYEIYLKGRQKLAVRGPSLYEAKTLFEQVIDLDPDYSPAYSGLGRTLALIPSWFPDPKTSEYIDQARESALHALELNPNNAEAHSVLGTVLAFGDWNFKEAEKHFMRSIQISPNDTEILNFLGDYYSATWHPRAIEVEAKALELDPLHPVKHNDLSFAYAFRNEWENSRKKALDGMALDSSLLTMFNNLITAEIALGLFEEAEKRLDSYPRASRHKNLVIKGFRCMLAAANGDHETWGRIIPELIQAAQNGEYNAIWLGESYLSMGKLEEAIPWIEKAYQDREYYLISSLVITLPELLPDHPGLREVLDKQELNELFEIRRQNLALSDSRSAM